MGCVLAQPSPSEESGGRWSDAELAAQNPITALQIQRTGSNRPCRIRARYGPDWAQWREINGASPKDGNEATLDLGLDAKLKITSVTGNCRNNYGDTFMLKAQLSDGA